MNPLPTAELVIYAVLSLPVLYIFVRHLPAGILGWFYLFAFCTIRVVGGAMSMKAENASASIISGVGLSPLLLATFGILHEAAPNILNKALEWTTVAFFHVLVASGVGLNAAGASALANNHDSTSAADDLRLVQIGIAILTACWVLLAVWAAMSLLASHGEENAPLYRQGTILLRSVIIAIVFVGIRVLYSLVAFCTQRADLNLVNGSLVFRVVLGFLPELIATIVFVVAGVHSRHVHKKDAQSRGAKV